jgi:GDPmannose 4,6-dehydratase
MFGLVQEIPQNEQTSFYPRSPYGVAKVYAHWITKNYRESYGMFAANGILFNHESPRRGDAFVTQKIVKGLYSIKNNNAEIIKLGNLDAKRDWGHAKDYVDAMWLILQQDVPDDYVIATGEQHSVREFAEISGKFFGFDLKWTGNGLMEKGYDANSGKILIEIDKKFFRPAEVDSLIGNSTKAREKLGWSPKISFEQLVLEMCREESNK